MNLVVCELIFTSYPKFREKGIYKICTTAHFLREASVHRYIKKTNSLGFAVAS